MPQETTTVPPVVLNKDPMSEKINPMHLNLKGRIANLDTGRM